MLAVPAEFSCHQRSLCLVVRRAEPSDEKIPDFLLRGLWDGYWGLGDCG